MILPMERRKLETPRRGDEGVTVLNCWNGEVYVRLNLFGYVVIFGRQLK